MPSTYAHRRFGADVLALLPDGLRQTLEQHRELYDMGLHGPDLMFYYKALQTNPVNRLGNAMHEEKGEVFPYSRPLHLEPRYPTGPLSRQATQNQCCQYVMNRHKQGETCSYQVVRGVDFNFFRHNIWTRFRAKALFQQLAHAECCLVDGRFWQESFGQRFQV